ncbi:MAG: MtrB/PioB family decaheme-associated outer membrane protein [Gammaproteobacteria bacterium]|nr:MtrB/PioB family decaheme-associated outer membrane protein [Gammaproteobacteria bacterium]NNJ80311.1 MtrB/PioB family decaheme-associated outer membrane protein [Xanthomonadales bacterium]
MKHKTNYSLRLAISACLAISAVNTLAAEEPAEAPDTSNWACKLCVVPYGWYGNLDFGLIYVDDPTPKFADYRGLIDDGITADLGGLGGWRASSGHFFEYYAANLPYDARKLEVEGGLQGSYDFRLNYQDIPRYQGHGTVTPYEGEGTDRLTLPSDWSYADQAPLDVALLESKRTIIGAGITFRALQNWKFDVDVQKQEKEGSKSFSGGLFFVNAALFPSPVHYETNRFDASVEYANHWLQLRAGFTGSDFNNDYSALTWDNPIAIGFGDEVSRTALEPDNEYKQFSLSGAVRITDWLRFSGKVSSGEVTQDDPFLPYSISPAYADRPLPRDSLDGRLETSMYNVAGRLQWRLARGIDLTASYKSNERDNKTPVDIYEPVSFEVYPRPPRSNRPYGYEREQGIIELRYRPLRNLRLNAGVFSDDWERTYQEVLETEEEGWFGEVQWSPLAMLDVRVKYDESERDASMSEQQGNYDRAENPLMRKFNMANRDRERHTLEIDLSPTERMGLSFSWYETEDTYTESIIGLTDSEESAMSVDFSYLFGKETNLYAFYVDETIEASIAGANGVGATPWTSDTEDSIETWGLGLSGKIKEKWTYGLDYVSSDSDGQILTVNGDANTPFPVLTTSLRNIRLYAAFDLNERWGIGLEAYNEEYETADWLVDGVGPYSIEGVLTMGEESPDYDVNVIRIMATYRL